MVRAMVPVAPAITNVDGRGPRDQARVGRATRKGAKAAATKRAPRSGGVGRYTPRRGERPLHAPDPEQHPAQRPLFGPAILFMLVFGIADDPA